MVRSPQTHRHLFTRLLALTAVASLAAACSDSTPKAAAPAPSAASDTTTVAVADTAAPATSDQVDTSVATTPATDSPAASIDLRGTWLLIEKVTENTGYLGDGVPVLSRYYKITCDDVACEGGTIVVAGPGGDTFGADYDMSFIFDGSKLFTQGSRKAACLDPTTGNETELMNSTVNTNVELTVDAAAGGFAGTITVGLMTDASAQCKGEDLGFTADLSMTRAAAPSVGPTPSIFVGSDTDNEGLQRGVLKCDSGCDYKMRLSLDDSTAEGPKLHEQIEFQLADQGDGTYTGTAHYKVSCLSDADGTFIAPDAYEVTHSVRVGWQLTVTGDPILVTIEKVVGEPAATLPTEQRAVCTSFTTNTSFAGLPLDDAAPPLVDWGVPAANGN